MSAAQSTLAQNTQKEIDFFRQHVAAHGDYDPQSEAAHRRILASVARGVRPRPGETGVDFGCGTGAFTRRLSAEFQLKMTGVDFVPEMVDYAKAKTPEAQFRVGDIRDSGLPSNTFDIIVYSGVLHHFPARDDRRAALREGLRVLKPGGRLFAYDPNANSPAMWLYRSPSSPLSWIFKGNGQTEDEILMSRKQLNEELREAGFGDVHVRGLGAMTLRATVNPIGRLIMPFYNLYELALGYSPVERWLGTLLTSFAVKPRA